MTFQVASKAESTESAVCKREKHKEKGLFCEHCCARFFDFKVFGIPLPGALPDEEAKYKLDGDRWTLNLNGELEKKSLTSG